MLREERHLRIRTLLSTLSRVSTERIEQDLQVSRETVRRDILALEDQGVLRRVHGGVVTPGPAPEPPLAVRQAVRAKEKRAIARTALQLLKPGQTVFLDAGSTTALLAETLATLPGLTIITNGLNVALTLAALGDGRPGSDHVILLGGNIDPLVQATFGEITVGDIHRYHADVAMLSPVGISSQHGATSFEHHEAAIARAMVRQAQQLVILADHSKIGQASRVAYARADEIDTLVTNTAASGLPELAALRAAGCRVMLA